MRVPFLGKERHHISVGKDKSYDYKVIQDAIDSIADSAEDNPYIVSVDAGIYDEQVTLDESYVSLVGRGDNSIIRLLASSGDSNGALRIANGSSLLSGVHVDSLHLVDEKGVAGKSTPPEAAIQLGVPLQDSANELFENVVVSRCLCDAAHTGIGVAGPTGAGSALGGRVTLQGNRIRAARWGIAVEWFPELTTSGNYVHLLTDLSHAPLLDHITPDAGSYSYVAGFLAQIDAASVASRAEWVSSGDLVLVHVNSNVVSNTNSQVAGVRLGSSTNYTLVARVTLNGLGVHVIYDVDQTPQVGVGGIMAVPTASANYVLPEDLLLIQGGVIDVEQLSAGGSAPASVYGVYLDSQTTASYCKITGTEIRGSNAAGTAYSLAADNAAVIEGRVSSDLGTTGSGTLTARTPIP